MAAVLSSFLSAAPPKPGGPFDPLLASCPSAPLGFLGSQATAAYVAIGSANEVARVSLTTGAVLGSPIAVGTDPVSLGYWSPESTAHPQVIVANAGSDSLSAIDVTTSSVIRTIPLSASPSAVAISPIVRVALVLEPAIDSVVAIEVDDGVVEKTYSLGLPGGTTPSGVAFSPDGAFAYVTDPMAHEIAVLAAPSASPYPFTLEAPYVASSSFEPVAAGSDASTRSSSSLFVSNEGTAKALDTFSIGANGSLTLSATATLGATPGAVAVTPGGASVFVVAPTAPSPELFEVTTATGSVTTDATTKAAGALGISPDGATVILGEASSTLDLIDLASGARTVTNSLLPGAITAVSTPRPRTLDYTGYVANFASNTVSVIDTLGDGVRQILRVGTGPSDVVVSPDGTRVYVADSTSDAVTVIAPAELGTASNPILKTVALPTGSSGANMLGISPNSDTLLVLDASIGVVYAIDTNPRDSAYLTVSPNAIYLDGTGQASGLSPGRFSFTASGDFAYVIDATGGTGSAGAVSVIGASSAPGSADGYAFSSYEDFGGLYATGTPAGIALTPSGGFALVSVNSPTTGPGLDTFSLSATNGTLLANPVATALGPVTSGVVGAVAISPGGEVATIQVTSTAHQFMVDLYSGTVTTTPDAGGNVTESAFLPDGSLFLTTDESSGCAGSTDGVSVFSGATGSLVATFPAGTSPDALALSPVTDGASGPLLSQGDLSGGAMNPSETAVASGINDVVPSLAKEPFGLSEGVDTATGAYSFRLSALSVPDIGLPLSLTLTYDSISALGRSKSGPLGPGWSFTYGMSLLQNPSSGPDPCQITVDQEDGSTVTFSSPPPPLGGPCPTSGYEAPSFAEVSLSSAANCVGPDPCYVMTRSNGAAYYFDQVSGELVKETDRNANTVVLSYNGSINDEVSSVTGASGTRALSLTWMQHQLSTVTDPLGRSVAFAYGQNDNPAGDLTSITVSGPGNAPGTYEFSYDQNNEMTAWWSPDNSPSLLQSAATAISYDPSFHVTSLSAPEASFALSSPLSPVAFSPTTTFSYAGLDEATGTGSVVVADPSAVAGLLDGSVTLDRYVDFALLGVTRGYGPGKGASSTTLDLRDPLTDGVDEYIDPRGGLTTTTGDAMDNPLLVTDPMGETTTDAYNSFSLLTSVTDPMGAVTTTAYDASGNATSSTTPTGEVTTSAYTPTGELCGLESANGYALGDRLDGCPSTPAPYVTAYGYDASGDLTSTTVYDGTANSVTSSYVSTSLYNPGGELCATLDANGYAMGDRLPASCPSSGAADESVFSSFDFYGDVTSSISPTTTGGGVTTSTYDPNGNETSSAGPNGEAFTTTYSPDGDICWKAPAAVTSPRCLAPPVGQGTETTSYTYDPNGLEVATIPPNGNASGGPSCLYASLSSYDDLGDTTASSTPTGGTNCSNVTLSTSSFGFDAAGNETSSTSPPPPGASSGVTTTSAYDADNNICWSAVASLSAPNCSAPPSGLSAMVTTTTYDRDGRVTSTTPPNGNASGDPGAYATTTTYDAAGEAVSVTTPPPAGSGPGETTTSYYDANGNVTATTGPAGNPYGPGNLTGCDPTTTPGCADSTYDAFDEANRAVSVTNPAGEVTTTAYDANGAVASSTSATGSLTTSATYDLNGAFTVTLTTTAAGTGASYVDANGDTVAMTAPGGDPYSPLNPSGCDPTTTTGCAYSTYETYNASNELVSVTNPDGAATTNYYDASGRVVAVTSPGGNPYGPGNPTGCDPTTSPACADTRYSTYDTSGRVTTVVDTDASGAVATSYSTAYGQNGERCWEATGVFESSCASPPAGATTYGYDTSGRLSYETTGSGATLTYGYDSNSNLTCASYPNQEGNTCASSGTPTGVVRYSFGEANTLSSLTDWAGNTLSFGYNQDGSPCYLSSAPAGGASCASPPVSPGAVTTTYGYDAAMSLVDAHTTTGSPPVNLLDLSATRNGAELITSGQATVASSANAPDTYTYDGGNRVSTGPVTSGGPNAYAYTAGGGITASPSAFLSAGYDQAGVLCWTSTRTSGSSACSSPPAGSTTYSTNSDGERTLVSPPSASPSSYGWDTSGNLLTCANTSGTTCSAYNPSASSTLYTYDQAGLRTSATTGTTTTDFTWGTAGPTPQLYSDGTYDYVYLPGSPTPVEQIQATSPSPAADLLIKDESNNVRGLVQLSGGTGSDQLVNYTDYGAYGTPITASGGAPEPGGLTVPETSLDPAFTATTPFGFGEGYSDPTGLVYLVHRYYDPTTAQFISVDPLVNITSQPYLYAADGPTVHSDPTGMNTLGWCVSASAGSAGISGHIVECLVSDSSGNLGYGSMTVPNNFYNRPSVFDIAGAIANGWLFDNAGIFLWTSPEATIWQLRGKFTYTTYTDSFGLQAQHIYGANANRRYVSQYLVGYQQGTAVGQGFNDPVDHGELTVGVHYEPSDLNKAVSAATIWAASLWYTNLDRWNSHILDQIAGWALAGVAVAGLVGALLEAFVGFAGVAAAA